MKKHFLPHLALALVTIWTAMYVGGDARAAGSDAARAYTFQVKQWERTLRRSGASSAELTRFEEIVKSLPPDRLALYEEYLRKTPPLTVVRSLRRLLSSEPAASPAALYPQAAPVMTCEALQGAVIPETTIDSAVIAASDGSCRITATVVHPPADNPIKIFVALPMKGWNGRFRGTGGGGYAGGSPGNLNAPVAKGYAVAATDTGNPSGTADFALGPQGKPAWQRMRDNAYRGIHDMTVVGKALTQAFYGQPPRYAYFVGGSTGGRQALTEAQRYPQDYDGILALYPAIARDRYVPAQMWPQILMNEANDFLPRAKLEAATVAAVKACDAADGALDGVIDDPTQCQYDPAALVGSKVGESTFTAADAKILRGIWEGPRAHDGGFLWWGPTRGTDLSILADTAGEPPVGKPCDEGLDWFRYFLLFDPKWDWRTLTRGEFELLFEQSIQTHASAYGGDDPDLTGFRDRHGKLLIVHGWADQVVPAQKSIAYYEAVKERMGGALPIADVLRLFMVPGADHGFGNGVPAPSGADMIAALMEWVEKGSAPQRLDAILFGNDGKVSRSRQLVPYRGQSKAQ